MKTILIMSIGLVVFLTGCGKPEKSDVSEKATPEKKLFLDVHEIGPGKVTFQAVEDAHKKDLAVQAEFGVDFKKYWVDEQAGKVYCLAESASEGDMFKAHEKAHGLTPDYILQVTEGIEAKLSGKQLFLDTHNLTPGGVTAEAVAAAHEKDLAVQGKYDVSFINYWVDEKLGKVMCLAEAPDSLAIIHTYTEAHGLVPSKVQRVAQGN